MPGNRGSHCARGKSRYQGCDQPGLVGEGTLERRVTGQLCKEGDLGGGLVVSREEHPQGHGIAKVVRGEVSRGRNTIQGLEGGESFTEEVGTQCLIPNLVQ